MVRYIWAPYRALELALLERYSEKYSAWATAAESTDREVVHLISIMMMMMMRRLSSLRVRAKPRHLPYIYIYMAPSMIEIYIYTHTHEYELWMIATLWWVIHESFGFREILSYNP